MLGDFLCKGCKVLYLNQDVLGDFLYKGSKVLYSIQNSTGFRLLKTTPMRNNSTTVLSWKCSARRISSFLRLWGGRWGRALTPIPSRLVLLGFLMLMAASRRPPGVLCFCGGQTPSSTQKPACLRTRSRRSLEGKISLKRGNNPLWIKDRWVQFSSV